MKPALLAAEDLFVAARRVAKNRAAAVEDRVAAVNVLGRGRDQQDDDLGVLVALLTPESPTALQLAAVNALGRFNRRNLPEQLLSRWGGYTKPVRAAVVTVLMSRPAWSQALLDRASAEPDFRAHIDAS